MLGSVRDIVVVVALVLMIVVIVLGGMAIAGVQAAQNILPDFCLMDCGPEYVVETGPIIQAITQQSWIEGARATDNMPNLYIEKDRPGPLGADSLRYNAFVVVTAGVDLELFSEDDVEVQDNNVVIYLPGPQIRDCILDEQNSAYYDGGCAVAGIIPTGVCDNLADELRKQALAAAANTDHTELLSQAFEGASETVLKLVENIEGVEKVTIEQSPKEIPLFSSAGTCDEYQTGR